MLSCLHASASISVQAPCPFGHSRWGFRRRLPGGTPNTTPMLLRRIEHAQEEAPCWEDKALVGGLNTVRCLPTNSQGRCYKGVGGPNFDTLPQQRLKRIAAGTSYHIGRLIWMAMGAKNLEQGSNATLMRPRIDFLHSLVERLLFKQLVLCPPYSMEPIGRVHNNSPQHPRHMRDDWTAFALRECIERGENLKPSNVHELA